MTDHLTYGHTGNRLTSLDHTNASGSVESSGTKSYSYDVNGNMTYDQRKGLHFNYNYLNLLQNVSQTGGTDRAGYAWLADGTKVQVTDNTDKGYVYLGSLVYSKEGGQTSFESTGFGSGRIQKATSGYDVNYHITDHLGSVRVVFNYGANGSINRIAQNDYYAFGKKHVNPVLRNASDEVNRWLYNGKEQQVIGDLGLMDFNTRMYNDELAIFHKMDLLTMDFPQQSPYSYAANNPVLYIDFMGLSPKTSTAEEDPIRPEEQPTPPTIEELIAAGYVVIFEYQAPPEKQDNYVEDPEIMRELREDDLNVFSSMFFTTLTGMAEGAKTRGLAVLMGPDGFVAVNLGKVGKIGGRFISYGAVLTDIIGLRNYYNNPKAKFKVTPTEALTNLSILLATHLNPLAAITSAIVDMAHPDGFSGAMKDVEKTEEKVRNAGDKHYDSYLRMNFYKR